MQSAPYLSLARQYGRVLNHGKAPRAPYIPRQPGEYRSICHQGQRKLLISEVELLTLAMETSPADPEGGTLVVYAGAAPGLHIPILSDMFPACTFHLYDPAFFAISCNDRIKIFNREFTDSDAAAYKQEGGESNALARRKLVLISDIRTKIDEESVWNDMMAQQQWHEIMQPSMCSLKFRLPWDRPLEETCQYLQGAIYLPVWGRTSTTEARLFIDARVHSGYVPYHPRIYEEEMSFFNRFVRPAIHLHTVKDSEFDRCYDCASEIWVLRGFLRAFHVSSNMAVSALSETITEGLRQQKLGLISFQQCHTKRLSRESSPDEEMAEPPCQNGQMADFWRQNSLQMFHQALRGINLEHPNSPKCACISCASGEGRSEYPAQCSFKTWFLGEAKEYGLVTAIIQNMAKHTVVLSHECCEGSFVLDTDSHFTTGAVDDWTPIRYGARIWKALTCEDPEVQKFTAFMRTIQTSHAPKTQEKWDETYQVASMALDP